LTTRNRGASVAVLLGLAVLAGCTFPETGPGDTGASSSGGGGPALAAVDGLVVKGRAPRTGYERDRFGSAWADTDSNGCGTRDDILARDLDDVRLAADHCRVRSGVLNDDPYSGRDITFRRGHSTVDIDHVVALSDAWQKGAQKWEASKRIAFANDPLNLLAVDSSANRRKGDGDTATWLPPNKAYRCAYVARQVAVKWKYEVWVTGAEKDAMRRVLTSCPGRKLPSGGSATRAPARFHAE
jgi:hypothetical protein